VPHRAGAGSGEANGWILLDEPAHRPGPSRPREQCSSTNRLLTETIPESSVRAGDAPKTEGDASSTTHALLAFEDGQVRVRRARRGNAITPEARVRRLFKHPSRSRLGRAVACRARQEGQATPAPDAGRAAVALTSAAAWTSGLSFAAALLAVIQFLAVIEQESASALHAPARVRDCI